MAPLCYQLSRIRLLSAYPILVQERHQDQWKHPYFRRRIASVLWTHSIKVHRGSVWRMLRKLGLTHKKDLQALERKRKDVAVF